MITARVSKMGEARLINVSTTDLRFGSVVAVKPKGVDMRVMRRVVSQGGRKIVVIPKMYHQYFPVGSDAFVSPIKKNKKGVK